MKKTEIVKSMNGFLSKTGFQLKKHSPEILVVAGVIGVVTSAVMACKATTKVDKIVENTKNDIDKVHTAIVENRGSTGDIENVTTAITAVSEAYPELKSNENYKELINELSITENLIAEYRSNYNKQVKEYNRYIRKFPTRFFLNILGYEVRGYTYLDYSAPADAPQNLFGE